MTQQIMLVLLVLVLHQKTQTQAHLQTTGNSKTARITFPAAKSLVSVIQAATAWHNSPLSSGWTPGADYCAEATLLRY